MAEQTIDKLQVEVTATAKGTSTVFNQLEKQLETLKKAFDAIDTSKLSKIQKAVNATNPKINTSGMSKAERDIDASIKKIQQSMAGLKSYADKAMSGDKSAFSTYDKQATSLQSTMDKLSEKFKQLGNQSIPTKAFESIDKQIEDTRSHLESLKAKEREAWDSGGKGQSTYDMVQLGFAIQEAEDKLKSLGAEQDKLINEGKAFYDPFEPYRESLYKVQATLSDTTSRVQTSMAEMANAQPESSGVDKFIAKLENEVPASLSKIQQDFAGLGSYANAALGGDKSAFTSFERRVTSIQSAIDVLTNKLSQLEGAGVSSEGLEQYRATLQCVQAQLNETANAVRTAYSEMSKSPTSEVSKDAEKAGASFKSMASSKSALDGISKSLGKIKDHLKGISVHGPNMSKMFKTILKYGFGIRSIYVLFRRLRKTLVESFGELQNSGAFYETTRQNIESLKTSLLTLKYQFGAAFEPIFNAVAPALKVLIDKLVDAMNAVSAFMARLTGNSTYSKVKWVNTATGEAAKNAKELNKQLQKFDELNNLTTNQGGSGSGSKDKTKAVYEEASVDSALGDFGKRLADLIRAGEWGEVGKVLSDKFAEQLESIDWNAIKRKAATFGQKLADFLNNLINPRLLGDIGMTIGEAINTGLTFFNEWGKGMNWENLGTSLAEGFDAFIQTGWIGNLGETLHTWIAGGLVALTTFFETADFEEVGKQIAEFIGNLNIPDLASKLLNLAKAIIFALADAIKSLWTNGDATTRIGMAIVGLIGLAKLTGIVGTIGGLITTSLSGSTITASATGATLKLTGLKKIAGLALTAGGALLPEFSLGENLLENTLLDALGATGMYGGLRLLGLSNPIAIKITAAKFAWDFGTELGKSLWGSLMEKLGDSEMAKYYREFSWAGFFKDIFEAAWTGNLFDGVNKMFGPEGFADNVSSVAYEIFNDDMTAELEEFLKTRDEFYNLIRNPFGGNELNTSDLGTSMFGAWKSFTDGANQANTAAKSLKDTVASFIEQTRNLNSETSRFGYEAENSTSKFRFGISGIASETVDVFQTAYNKGTKTWSGLGTWAKSKSKDMGNGFVGIPKEVASKFQTAYTESTKAWNDIGTWATGVTNTTANGMNNLPTDVSKRFGDAYTQGTAKWNDLGRWATERSAITSGAFNTFPTTASKQFGDAYTQGTGKWSGLKTWADQTFSAVSTSSNTSLNKIPSQFQTNFQQGTSKAESVITSFKQWFDRQELVKEAGVKPDNSSFNTVQTKINNIITLLGKVKSTTVSVSGSGFEAMGSKIRTLANQISSLKSSSSSLSLSSSLGVQLFASGGVVGGATPAIVGEAGPEAILPLTDGTLGKLANMIVGDMAVPNSPVLANQSYSSYSNTMNASSMAEQNKLLQEQNDLLRQIASKDLTISSSEVFNATRSEANNYYNRTGNSPFLI